MQPIRLSELKELWGQWSSIVDRLAHSRRGGAGISAARYRLLHTALLEACRAPVAANDGPSPEIPNALAEIAQPWVSLDSLKEAKKQILKTLWHRCLVAERELLGRPKRLVSVQKLISICLILAAVIVALVHMNGAQGDGFRLPSLAHEVQALWTQLVYSIRFSSFLERFSFVTIIVVIVAIVLGTQTVRRWS